MLDVLGGKQPEGWEKLDLLIRDRQTAQLEIASVPGGADQATLRLSLSSKSGAWPEGNAAVYVTQPQKGIVIASAGRPNLVAVPPTESKPLDFAPFNERDSALELIPLAWFRGRVQSGRGITIPRTELVKVEIKQLGTGKRLWTPFRRDRFAVADQFQQHQQIGYFHTGTAEPLRYAIKVTNLTDHEIETFVYWDLAGAPGSKRLKLAAGGTDESIRRQVVAQDFKDEKPETLTINARERDRNGRSLCVPYQVIFKPTDPRPFVTERVVFEDRMVTVVIDHSDADPVPLPVNVDFVLDPVGHFQVHGIPPRAIPWQGYLYFYYDILEPSKEVSWQVFVNSLPKKKVAKLYNEEQHKKPDEADVPKDSPDANAKPQ